MILDYVNNYNEILWDVIVPKGIYYYYEVAYQTQSQVRNVPLITDTTKPYFVFSVKPELLVKINDNYLKKWNHKSFHVDNYALTRSQN